MIRKILNYTIQNKNFVMFLTAMVYIVGLFAAFSSNAILVCIILSVLMICAILKNYISPKLALFWIFIFYFAYFNASFRISTTDDLFEIAPKDVRLVGQITSIPNSNFTDKSKFFFDVKSIDGRAIQSKTLVTVYNSKGDFSKLNIGNFYEINAKLRQPFKAGNPYQFDYGRYLRNFGAHTVVYANLSDCNFVSSPKTVRWKFWQSLNDKREEIIKTHSKFLKSPNLEILGGIVFGDDAVAPPDYVKTSFVNSGLLHILAASGMNVAFIYGFWFFILIRLGVPYKATVITGIGVVILYALMTGLGPSVIRAAIMLIFILIGKLLDRDAHSVSLLAFVALLMLIYNPAYINDVGFQLSFIVTFGLLTTANIVFEKLKFMPNWLSGAILIPVVAQVWVVPIQMFYFNTISLYSVFANISIVPFLSIISFGGFVGSVLALVPKVSVYACQLFDWILNPLLNILTFISNFFSKLPHSILITTHPSVYQIILYYGIVLTLTLVIKRGKDKRIFVLLGILILFFSLSFFSISAKNVEVIAFDVQNADSFLIKSQSGKYFLIDSGKSGFKQGASQAEAIILKYFKNVGIKNLQALIVTHFDNDHSGGVPDILNEVKVSDVFVNSYEDSAFTSKKIYKILNEKHINSLIPDNKKVIYAEPKFKLITYIAKSDSDNESSIITLLECENFKMLFMGDAGLEAYYKLKKDLPDDIDILKVGHHGAKNVVNKDMVDYLKPEVSLISVGKNMFGHPNRVTLDYLKNTKIYRTDKHNSIKIVSNKKSYKIYSFNKNKRAYDLVDIRNLNNSK